MTSFSSYDSKDLSSFGDPGTDPVNVEVDIDAVDNGFVVSVLLDKVLIEESNCLSGGRSGQASQKGIEVQQDLFPEIVNGAMALIDDDEVEEFWWDTSVEDDIRRLSFQRFWNDKPW